MSASLSWRDFFSDGLPDDARAVTAVELAVPNPRFAHARAPNVCPVRRRGLATSAAGHAIESGALTRENAG